MLGDNNYVTVDLDILRENFRTIREKAGVPVIAVIKANAYGHGVVPVAEALSEKCDFFAVACIQEAVELRNAGIGQPVLVLGHMPVSAYPQAVRLGIRPVIFRWEDAQALSREAVRQGIRAPFHFALDTGMSRLGLEPTEESARLCRNIANLPGLDAEGLFSHFATADEADLSRARAQMERFGAFDAMLRAQGVQIRIRHLNNSAGIMNFKTPYDMVRAGIILYGLYPSDEVDPQLLPIRPILRWDSRIAQLKWLEPGRQVSYGGTFTVRRPTLAATVAVGYADGYRRSLSNRFYVLIRGRKAPILGRVCMDQMIVDVTDIPDVTEQDPVTLVGTNGEARISVEQIAAQAESFNYEFVSCIGHRVPRYYVQNGKVVRQACYLLDSK